MVQKQKKRKLLLIEYEQLSREEILATILEMSDRLKQHFKFHLGEEEPTSPAEIFEVVLEVNPEDVNTYKREYWWNILKRVMRSLRSSGELFIIHKGHKYFVLRTQKEADYYKKILRTDIKNMKRSMKRADEWVKEEKWRNVRQLG